jgi:Family of unknown function (DUF6134)
MRAPFGSSRPVWLGIVCLLAPGLLRAAETQTRVYAIYVDNKPAGECRLIYTTDADGSESISGHATVRVKKLLGTYSYQYDGTEVWKANRLQKLTSSCDDDGKKSTVDATAGARGLRVVANGSTSHVETGAWPTSYWRLVAPELRKKLTLLEADTGRVLNGHLHPAGPFRVKVGELHVECALYKLTGDLQAELWYDAQGRLVRQVSIEEGHKTLIHLKQIGK